MRDKIIIKSEDAGKRLDHFLQKKFSDFSRSHIQKAIEGGDVFLIRNKNILKNVKKSLKNDEKPLKNGEILKKDDIINYFFQKPKEINLNSENMNLDIIYEDPDIAIINKPQGLVVHPCTSCPEKTLVNGLIYQIPKLSGLGGEFRPGIVHRLDKNTCGLILIAKNDVVHNKLSKKFAKRECERRYLALVEGVFKKSSGIIETKIGRNPKDRKKMAVVPESNKVAVTEHKTLEEFIGYSLVEFSLKTGRTHQIRVHAKHLSHPIVGDAIYGSGEKFGLKGQFLCAYRLKFDHPSLKKEMEFKIDLPKDFEKILNNLRKNKNIRKKD